MIRLNPILPQHPALNVEEFERAIENALTGLAEDIRVDFEVTAQTWVNKPAFKIDKRPFERDIYTESEIYSYVARGTRPHVILPKIAPALRFRPTYKAKTRPRYIGSTGGGASGPFVTARVVHHPGTEARDFERVIAEKWQKLWPNIMQRAIASEVQHR